MRADPRGRIGLRAKQGSLACLFGWLFRSCFVVCSQVMSMIPGLGAQLMPKGKEAESAQRINRFMHMMDRARKSPPPAFARMRACVRATARVILHRTQ